MRSEDLKGPTLDREARAAAAGRRGDRILDLERGTDQIVHKVDFGASHILHGHRIDQNDDALTRKHEIVRRLGAVQIEFVLKARAAAAFDADPQHGTSRLLFEDFADTPRGSFGEGDGRHDTKCLDINASAIARVSLE